MSTTNHSTSLFLCSLAGALAGVLAVPIVRAGNCKDDKPCLNQSNGCGHGSDCTEFLNIPIDEVCRTGLAVGFYNCEPAQEGIFEQWREMENGNCSTDTEDLNCNGSTTEQLCYGGTIKAFVGDPYEITDMEATSQCP